MLKPLATIVGELRTKAARLVQEIPGGDPGYLEGTCPAEPGMSSSDVEMIEHELGLPLSADARNTLENYDLDGLELGGVAFGGIEPLPEFIAGQLAGRTSVWGTWPRLEGFAVVGSSSGYVLLLDCRRGGVWACLRERQLEDRFPVAASLELLLRGLGTLALTDRVDDAVAFSEGVARDAGAPSSRQFWLDRTLGFA